MPNHNPTRADLPDVPPTPIGQVTAIISMTRTLVDVIAEDWARLSSEEEPHSLLADALAELADAAAAVNEAHHRAVTAHTTTPPDTTDLHHNVTETARYLAHIEHTAERLRAAS